MFKRDYKALVLLGIFLTGATALIAQVAWQRYFGHLIGGDHRSSSLVLAIFLTGLTIGYWYFGRFFKKDSVRSRLFKNYAVIEAIVGFCFLAFPLLFGLLTKFSDILPNSIFSDFFIILAGIGLPAFLMGSTLPILSLAMPDAEGEVHQTHVLIYAFNTLGAFLGASFGGIFFLPLLGLKFSLIVCGLVNLVVAIVFFNISKRDELNSSVIDIAKRKRGPETLELSPKLLLATVFIVGSLTIGLELIVIRILSISVSGLYIVFPVVVGSFVFGMGLGSLWLSKHSDTSALKIKRLLCWGAVGLMLFYITAPYWPYVFHVLRSQLNQYSWGWTAYRIVCFFLTALVLLPITFFLGQVLPACFVELSKHDWIGRTKNSKQTGTGATVSLVYALSTLGTLFGALGLGYMALSIMNIDTLVKILFLCLLALIFVLSLSEPKNRNRIIVGIVFVHALFLPNWNYTNLVYAEFSKTLINEDAEWKWGFPKLKDNVSLIEYKDGPDLSAAVTEVKRPHPSGKSVSHRVISINGKIDGSTYGDYATNALMSVLPYLLGTSGKNQKAAVVGLGTGVSASVLGMFEDIISVDAIDISQTVIEFAKHFEDFNYGVLSRKKIKLVHQDAIRFLKNKNNYYDLIVSEPSNLWIGGNQNLFFEDYMQIVKGSLKQDAIYAQWMHSYNNDKKVFLSVVNNLTKVFKYAALYRLQQGDYLLLASDVPIKDSAEPKRFLEPGVSSIRFRTGWRNPESISLAYILDQQGLQEIIDEVQPPKHNLNKPVLSTMAGRAWFYKKSMDESWSWIGANKGDLIKSEVREKEFARMAETFDDYYPECVTYVNHLSSLCVTFMLNEKAYDVYKDTKQTLANRLQAYSLLRKRGLVPKNNEFE